MKAGLDKARADGKTLGRPRLIVNRTRVLARSVKGESIRAIAAAMGLTHGTVQRIVAAR